MLNLELVSNESVIVPTTDYSARHLTVLEGLEAVRKRPGMYIGGTDERALHHLVAEVLDNSMDEAVAGHANRIEVELHADYSVTIRDNGRGIPVDPHPKFPDKSALEVILCTLHADGPSSLKRLRSRGCADLSTLLSRTPNALAEDLSIERPAARRLIREGRLLADRVGVSALEVEEAPPTADALAPTRALIQEAAQQPAKAGGLDSLDRALVERITRPAPTQPADPSSEPETPSEIQEPIDSQPVDSQPAAAAPGLDASLPDWLEGPAVPTADDPFSVPGADFGPTEVLAEDASAAALDPEALAADGELDGLVSATALPPMDAPREVLLDGGEVSNEQPAVELTFSEAPTVAEAQDLAIHSGEGPMEDPMEDAPAEPAATGAAAVSLALAPSWPCVHAAARVC